MEAKKLAKNDSLDDTKDTERDKTAGKVRGIYYTVKNAKGDVVYNTIPGSVTTGAAFNDGSLSATDQLTINVVKADASNVYANSQRELMQLQLLLKLNQSILLQDILMILQRIQRQQLQSHLLLRILPMMQSLI